jgi:membrane protein involved in colicin uptake
VANKETEGENKAFEEIERLANEQANTDKDKSKGNEAKIKKEAERAAKEQAKKEAEEAKKAKKEAEKLAKEQAKKEAKEAKQAKKEAERLAKEQDKQAKKEPAPDASSATYQGNFQLVLPPSAGFKQVKQFSESLAGVAELKVIWTGGVTEEGALIAISVAQAVPLALILGKMPMVEGVEVKGDKIDITFKTSA